MPDIEQMFGAFACRVGIEQLQKDHKRLPWHYGYLRRFWYRTLGGLMFCASMCLQDT